MGQMQSPHSSLALDLLPTWDGIEVMERHAPSARALDGKVALVTGSTSGIGLSVARALAELGARIVLNGFGTTDAVSGLVASVENDFGVSAMHLGADMGKPGEIAALMEKALNAFGGLDILVNNAGIQHVAKIDAFPVEKWDVILAINLSSAFHTTRLALPIMRLNGCGRIINIASAHALVGAYQVGVYEALHEKGIEPDWLIGTSIGAINASIIAGNRPADRLTKLREFWRRVEHAPALEFAFDAALDRLEPAKLEYARRGASPGSSGRILSPFSAGMCRSRLMGPDTTRPFLCRRRSASSSTSRSSPNAHPD